MVGSHVFVVAFFCYPMALSCLKTANLPQTVLILALCFSVWLCHLYTMIPRLAHQKLQIGFPVHILVPSPICCFGSEFSGVGS